MHEELPDVFARVGQDPEVSAVVLTGAGRGFCSGGNVRAMDERGGSSRGQPGLGAVFPSGRRLLHNMLWVEQPIICALNGVAAGLGATIALFCDIIYASDQASIGDAHVRAGLVAGDGGAAIWPLLVGVSKEPVPQTRPCFRYSKQRPLTDRLRFTPVRNPPTLELIVTTYFYVRLYGTGSKAKELLMT